MSPQSRNLWNCHLRQRERERERVDLPRPGLQNMNSQSRNLWNCHLRGVDLPKPGLPNMSYQSGNLGNDCLVGGWKICQDLVCQIWALRVGICEIVIWDRERGVNLPRHRLPNMNSQNRNLWNGHSRGEVDIPRPSLQIWALRVGICDIAIWEDRSPKTWPAKYELSD